MNLKVVIAWTLVSSAFGKGINLNRFVDEFDLRGKLEAKSSFWEKAGIFDCFVIGSMVSSLKLNGYRITT
jgi:hypothetical protein